MATALTPEEQALLDSIPDDPNAPAQGEAPEAGTEQPDMGIIGGALNAMGLWDAPQPENPEATPEQQAQRQDIQSARSSGPLGALNSVLGAPLDAVAGTIGGGAMKGVFETKDFLFGDTPASQQSDFRYNIEQDVKDDAEASMLNGVAASFGQFAVGMLGVGKLAKATQVASAAKNLTGIAKAGYESGKAALAGFLAFDPHEERLSNAVQGTFLANPVNEWLSAKDDDGQIEGRLKNAIESIGMDATLGATFLIGGKIYKALKLGNYDEADRLVKEFETDQQKQLEAETASNEPTVAGAGSPNGDPELMAANPTAVADDGIPYDLEGTRTKIDASKVGNANVETTHNQFSGMETSDLGGAAGVDVGPPSGNFLEEFGKPTHLQPRDLKGIWAKSDPEKTSTITKLLSDLAKKSWRVEALDGEFRIAKFTNGQWVGVQKAGSDPAIDRMLEELTATQFNEKMGRTVPTAKFNSMASEAWGGSRQAKYQPSNGNASRTLEAANQNPGGATSVQPEGGPAGINVKVSGDQTPIDPATNGFGVPKRAKSMTNPQPYIKFADENTKEVMSKSLMDVEAVDGNGGFYEAMMAGHKFGDNLDTVPYHKFTTQPEIDNFIARAVDSQMENLDALKGGEVMTDAKVDQTVKRMVKLTGVDPGFVLGKIQQMGALAPQMVAQMEVGFTLAQKAWTDTYSLNARYMTGDFSGYSTKEAMWQDIQHRLSVATTMYGAARSIMSNSGRAMRRMRRDFMFDPSKFKDVDPGKLSAAIAQSNASPQALKRLVDDRGILALTGDTFEFLRISGLISGPVTQIINMTTSGMAMTMRPMERLLGATLLTPFKATDALGQMGRDLRQYHAMGSDLISSFKDAGQAFLLNDSVLTPHANEWTKANKAPGAQPLDGQFFRYRATDGGDHTAINNLAYNVLSVAGGAGSVPTRALGTVDELIKQTTYRSYVQSRAAFKASTEGASKGLTGKALRDYVKAETELALDAAFDSAGRATDPNAIKEALLTTFQADLGAFGKKVQGLANANYATRFVLPFVKTPSNIIKYGARLTPGLNLLMKEVRDDLKGLNGLERQAQATGQMGLGTMYLAAGAYLASSGMITGGGPSDPKAKQLLTESGWRPYSIVKTDPETGKKTYYQLNRFDPIIMPIAIAADVTEHLNNTEWDGDDDSLSSLAMETMQGVSVAMTKQFVNKSYLLGASQFLDAVMDPDNKGAHFAQGAAASLIPYSSATRQLDQDEYMKDAQSMAEAMRAVTPGMGDGVPHRRNWLGEKVGAPGTMGNLVLTGEASPIEAEGQRIALRTGRGFGKMSYTQQGVDLREITLKDGRTAYEALQDLTSNPRASGRGTTLKQALNKLVTSDAYLKLPDGEASEDNTKSGAISDTLTKYRQAAWKRLLASEPDVREAFMTQREKAQDKFREVRGLPLRQAQDQNTIQHVLDAFGLGDD